MERDLITPVKNFQYPLFRPNVLPCPCYLSKATTNQSMVPLVVSVERVVFLFFFQVDVVKQSVKEELMDRKSLGPVSG